MRRPLPAVSLLAITVAALGPVAARVAAPDTTAATPPPAAAGDDDRVRRERDAAHALATAAGRADALRELASRLGTEGRIDLALEVVGEARAAAAAEPAAAEPATVRALELEASLLQTAGRSRESLELLERALESRRRRGETAAAATDLNLMATALFLVGEYDAAAERAYAGLRTAAEAGATAAEARARFLLAMIDRQLGRLDEALELLRRAGEAARRADDATLRQQALNEEANVLSHLGRTAEAIARKREALELARELGVPGILATCEHDMAVLLHLDGDLEGALAAYRAAHETFRELGMVREASVSAGNVSVVLGQLGRSVEGAEWAQRAVALARRGELPTEERSALVQMATNAADRGDLRTAYESLAAAYDLAQQAATGDTAAAVEDLEARFEAERRQAELEHERVVRELDLKRERLRRRLWFGAFVAALGFLALLAHFYRLKTRANRTITRAHGELEAAHRQLEELARTDALTGLANRREVEERLREEVLRSDRSRRELSLLMLDVDHFKQVNDRHGHETGDQVLQHLAAILRDSTRALDLVGRWGGEEFVVVLPETPPEGARVVAESIRQTLRRRPCRVGGAELPVTVTIGLAAYRGEGSAELLRRADEALYAGKHAGRDRVVDAAELTPASAPPA